MKKIFTILAALVLISVMSFSAMAEAYEISSETFTMYSANRGITISASDGKTIKFDDDNSEGLNSGATFWSGAQLMAEDDMTDGFTVKITNIEWDSENNNAVVVVVGTGRPWCGNVEKTDRNITLMVTKDGKIVFWAAGKNSNHIYGKWAPILETSKRIGANETEITYTCKPVTNGYEFYVNSVLVWTYDSTNLTTGNAGATDTAAIDAIKNDTNFSSMMSGKVNFGFQVLNGNADGGAYSKEVAGKLSYTVDFVDSAFVEGADKATGTGTIGGDKTPTTDAPTTDAPATEKPADATAADVKAEPAEEAEGLSTTTIIIVAVAAVVVIGAIVAVVVAGKKKKD